MTQECQEHEERAGLEEYEETRERAGLEEHEGIREESGVGEEVVEGTVPGEKAAGEAGENEKTGEGEQKAAGSGLEGIYERLDISVKAVDRFILVCVIALIAVILIGVLKARHMI